MLTYAHDAEDKGTTAKVVEMACKRAVLTKPQLDLLKANVECACEGMYDKWHNGERSLPFVRRREKWHPTNRPPSGEELLDACGDRADIAVLAEVQMEEATYREMWDAGTWREMTHPAQPADPKAPRAYCDPVRFWQSDEIKGKFPRLNAIAIWWLFVPLSSACVERSFSLLHYMQDSNRMSMTDESIMNEIFVRCHRMRIERWAAMEFAAMR